MNTTNSSLTLDRDAEMTSRFIQIHTANCITIWPSWGFDGLRINATPEQLRELRDLIDEALALPQPPASGDRADPTVSPGVGAGLHSDAEREQQGAEMDAMAETDR